jgi:phosphoglycerate dehydrogenase-like enzyme
VRVVVYLENDVFAFAPSAAQLARLASLAPNVELVACHGERQFKDELPRADAIVVWRLEVSWLERSPVLRHVFTPAAGREAIEQDSRVTAHFGTFHGHLMAESLLGMMLFENRRFGVALAAQRERRWERPVYATTRRLAGQTALLIGYGTIAEHCARLLSALDVRVHGLRRDPTKGGRYAERMFGRDDLLDAVAIADHVACILPSDTGTDRLLGEAAFARMKPTACVYNIGRGNAIDAPALVHALERGAIAAAFLDVVPEEPLPADSPLWNAPNLHLTPHASAINAEYLDFYFAELGPELETLAATR